MLNLVAVEDALAAYRLTRLVAADVITERPRRALIEQAYRRAGRHLEVLDASSESVAEAVQRDQLTNGPPPKLAVLLTCRWCAGVHVAVGVVVARRCFPRLWQPVAEVASLAALAALLTGLED